ncbi:MAG: DUF2206 domain-containing protein [Candidatus Bathyarchaeota archaeon]|nr:DUF2206 domain-containing protein [Candidatus Bathyarchaeota archaeon]
MIFSKGIVSFNQRYISQHFLVVVVALQVLMYLSLFLGFDLARVVIGIAYLTFIPGFLLIKILKLDNLGMLESLLFSVGFSVAFLMLSGLVINEFGSLFGLSFPLATLPLSLFINTVIIICAVVAHLRQSRAKPPALPPINFTAPMLLLLLIPLLAIVGAYFVNVTGNNLILLLTVVGIAALFSVGVFTERTSKSYAFAVLMIALALLLMVTVSTTFILPYGGDSPVEMYVFRTTQLNQHWNPIFTPADEAYGRYNAMLSITMLPTVYSNMLGLDPTWVYKIIYPLLFALVPVGLYVLWQPYIGKKFAFAAAFLFMAQSTFYTEMIALNRQMIGELFFVLLLLVILNKNVGRQGKFVAFAVFGFGLIFSHYALAEIFLFLIVAAWAASVLYLKKPSFNLQLSMIVFFFVAMFLWYIYTSGSVVFDSFMSFTGYISAQLGDFFNPASRGQAVLTGLGLTQAPSFLNTISRGFAYLTEIFIVLGVVALLRKKMPFKFERDFTVFSILAVILLVMLTLVPGLANALSMQRFYHILLMVLAPFCIVGMWLTAQLLFKRRKELMVSVIIVAVLVPYFLFQTNFVYEVAGTESWSVPLSGYRMNPVQLYGTDGYIDGYSVYGAEWVSNNTRYEYNIVGDNALYTALPAYGLIYRGYIMELTNATVFHSGQYVYLSYISIHYEPETSNGTLPRLLNQTSVIYSNGGSEIYYIP